MLGRVGSALQPGDEIPIEAPIPPIAAPLADPARIDFATVQALYEPAAGEPLAPARPVPPCVAGGGEEVAGAEGLGVLVGTGGWVGFVGWGRNNVIFSH